MSLTPDQHRNLYVLFIGLFAASAVYTAYANYHSIKVSKLQEEELKRKGNGQES